MLLISLGWNLQWTLFFSPQQKSLCSRHLPPFLNFSTFFSWSACLWRGANSTWTIRWRLIVGAGKCPGQFFNLSDKRGDLMRLQWEITQNITEWDRNSITAVTAASLPPKNQTTLFNLHNLNYFMLNSHLQAIFLKDLFTQRLLCYAGSTSNDIKGPSHSISTPVTAAHDIVFSAVRSDMF